MPTVTTETFQTIGIVVNPQKREAYCLAVELVAWLREQGRAIRCDAGLAERVGDGAITGQSVADVAQGSDLVVVFGGDGTLLNLAGELEGHDAPIVGVKMGGLGFLTEVTEDEVRETLEAVFAGRYQVTHRTMAEATVTQQPEGTLGPFPALNEVAFSAASTARLVALECSADDAQVTRYLCDGLILCTPTGSTAHNLAAGGPIVAPNADVFVLTPICPHTLTMRPIVISADTEVAVRVDTPDAEVRLMCDGQEVAALGHGDTVRIRRSPQRIRIVSSLHRDYYTILRTKLKWGER